VSICREAFFRKFLEPVVRAYRRMGIPAQYESPADIAVGHRKISGIGAGEIGDCVVLVGNVLVDFDFDTMCRMLKVPDDKFRARIQRAMEDNMTTVRREIGDQAAARWGQAEIAELLVSEFGKLLGSLEPCNVDTELRRQMDQLAHFMTKHSWLHKNRRQLRLRTVTIRSGLQLCQESIETPAGPMSIEFEVRNGISAHVSISGEACQRVPATLTGLKSSLIGIPPKEIRTIVSKHFAGMRIPRPILTDERA